MEFFRWLISLFFFIFSAVCFSDIGHAKGWMYGAGSAQCSGKSLFTNSHELNVSNRKYDENIWAVFTYKPGITHQSFWANCYFALAHNCFRFSMKSVGDAEWANEIASGLYWRIWDLTPNKLPIRTHAYVAKQYEDFLHLIANIKCYPGPPTPESLPRNTYMIMSKDEAAKYVPSLVQVGGTPSMVSSQTNAVQGVDLEPEIPLQHEFQKWFTVLHPDTIYLHERKAASNGVFEVRPLVVGMESYSALHLGALSIGSKLATGAAQSSSKAARNVGLNLSKQLAIVPSSIYFDISDLVAAYEGFLTMKLSVFGDDGIFHFGGESVNPL